MECIEKGDTDLNLQLAGLALMFLVSVFGTSIPLLLRAQLTSAVTLFSFFKCFGGGVLISTSIIHMLGAASESFDNPCLIGFFSSENAYKSWAGAFTLVGILSSCFLQIFAAIITYRSKIASKVNIEFDEPFNHQMYDEAVNSNRIANIFEVDSKSTNEIVLDEKDSLKIGAYMLEFGVCIHSVLIGMSLSSVGKSQFIPLLIALSIHQLFESLAVSAAVSDAFSKDRLKTLILAVIYTLSTPLGCTIGILMRGNLMSHSVEGIVIQGVIEAVAAGILLFDAISNLIVPFFKSTEFITGKIFFQLSCVSAMWLGAVAMSVIGLWA